MERVYCNTLILKEVAAELGLPIEVVKEIVSVQTEYTKQTIEQGTYDSIRWPYLGIFKSKPKEVMMLNHLAGMTPEQQKEFKRDVRTGKIKLWKK